MKTFLPRFSVRRCAALVSGVVLCLSAAAADVKVIPLQSRYEVAGEKIAIKEINPLVPRNWDGFNFVVLEYRISTSQRFSIGFTTRYGYNELRVHSYTPNAWNRLAIPLSLFRYQPGAAVDMAATYNQPRQTGWVNLGGRRGELHDVDSIGFRMWRPIGDQKVEIRNIYLCRTDPGDLYMGDGPAVDEFGQSMLVDYPEKVQSLEQLEREWQAEDEALASAEKLYTRYGGYPQKRLHATGFFRVEKWRGRWWMVDPEGYLFLSVGVDCVNVDNGGWVRNVNQWGGMFEALPPAELMRQMGAVDVSSGEPLASFGRWNIYRRYGDDWLSRSLATLGKRMDKWGINTVANWSSEDVKRGVEKAFVHQLYGLGISGDLMGLADVYDPQFAARLRGDLLRQTAPYKDSPWLIGYFLGNEPAWQGREVELSQMIIDGPQRPIKDALRDYLAAHGDTRETRKAFIMNTFRLFLSEAAETLKQIDPNHMNLGMRFGDPNGLNEDFLRMCGEAFDVFSFNCYAEVPRREMLDRVMKLIDRPVMIGEYHFGTVDRGYGQSLWQVDNQRERGVAYRYYTEQAFAHPAVVGAAYFQWADQDLLGRRDGENYNCGLIDVTDRPYQEQTEAMAETARRLFDIHRGHATPTEVRASRVVGHGGMPDKWNQ